MRAFVTGATGFIGGALARALRGRDDEVVALVRSPERAATLADLGCVLVRGDVATADRHVDAMRGCDAVFHLAATYTIGIPKRERPAMFATNVTGTEKVLDGAVEAGVPRIVYVSTVNAFGNTRGKVVDEEYRRPGGEFVSYYDETKYLAHVAAEKRIGAGAPVMIVQPGLVYGLGDRSEAGGQFERAALGTLPFLSFPDVGFSLVHVDDVATGILLAHDRGRIGERYVIAGNITRMREAIETIAAAAGRRPPRRTMPTWAMKASIPFGRVVGKVMGVPPNLREIVSASDGVTYWATSDKARRELGYRPRDMSDGLAELARDILAEQDGTAGSG